MSLSLSVSSNTQFCSFIDLSDSYRYSYFWDDDDEDGGGGVGEDDDSDGDVKLNVSWVEWPTKVTYVQEVFLTQDQAGLNTSDRQNYQSPCSKQSHIIQTANVHFQWVLLWLDIMFHMIRTSSRRTSRLLMWSCRLDFLRLHWSRRPWSCAVSCSSARLDCDTEKQNIS